TSTTYRPPRMVRATRPARDPLTAGTANAAGTVPVRSSTTHAAGCAVSSTPLPTDVTAALAPASPVAPVLEATSSTRPSRATNAPASQVSSAPARLAPGSGCGADGFEVSDMLAPPGVSVVRLLRLPRRRSSVQVRLGAVRRTRLDRSRTAQWHRRPTAAG